MGLGAVESNQPGPEENRVAHPGLGQFGLHLR